MVQFVVLNKAAERATLAKKAPLFQADSDLDDVSIQVNDKKLGRSTTRSKKSAKEVTSEEDVDEEDEEEIQKKKKKEKSKSKIQPKKKEKKGSIKMVSFKYDIPDEDHSFHALHKRTGSIDVQKIILKNFNPEKVSIFYFSLLCTIIILIMYF